MNLFAQSAKGLPLTPGQRAFLRLVEGFCVAGLVSVAPVIAQALGQQNVDWPSAIRLALGTFAAATLMAAVKYCKAQGDKPLADVLATVAHEVNLWAGLNDVGNKPAKVATAPTAAVPPTPTADTPVAASAAVAAS